MISNQFPARTRQEDEVRAPQRERVVLDVTPITATSAGAAQELLEIPADRDFQIGDFEVCNATGTAATFSMHIVPSGGTAGTGNLIYNAESVPANDRLTPAKRYSSIVNAGSTIEIHSGTSSALNIHLWGMMLAGGDPL